jgi:hypothetical protein
MDMKRGQITIFVILGLVLLLIAGIVILLPEKTPQVPQSQDATLVTNIVQQCLAQIGEQSIRTVSSTGGYAETSTLKDLPTADTEVVTLAPEKIPLWHEIHTCKEIAAGCIGDHRPSLCAKDDARCPVHYQGEKQSIQENIEKLVERNIDACLSNFAGAPQLQVTTTKKPRAHALIRDQDVVLSIDYPMEVHTSSETFPLQTFSTTLDVRLPQMYTLAYMIQATERSTSFVEEIFLHLLSIYNYNYEQPLPPFRDIQFQGAQRIWKTTQAKQLIEQGLLPYMDFIQIMNAEESYIPLENPDVNESVAPYANGIYEYMSIKLNDTTYPLAVRFEYPRTPMHLDINGKQLLKPRVMPDTGVLKLLGLKVYDYRFRYSASFPMLIRVSDASAFSNRGLDFNFGIEANVRNNHPLNVSQPITNIDFAPTTLDLAGDAQLVDRVYTIAVNDRYTGKPLRDVSIAYACGLEYALGQTNSDGAWSGKLPYCISGGFVLASKEGYATFGVERNSATDTQTAVAIELWQLQPVTLNVYKRTVADIATAGKTPLGRNDSLVLEMNKVKEIPYEDDVPLQTIMQFGGTGPATAAANSIKDAQAQIQQAYDAGQLSPEDYKTSMDALKETQLSPEDPKEILQSYTLELVPGSYIFQGTLVYNGLLQIPPRTVKGAELPAQNFTTWQSGGLVIGASTPFVLRAEDLYAGKNITVYVLEQKVPQTWEDIEKMQSVEEYQAYEPKSSLVRPEVS